MSAALSSSNEVVINSRICSASHALYGLEMGFSSINSTFAFHPYEIGVYSVAAEYLLLKHDAFFLL